MPRATEGPLRRARDAAEKVATHLRFLPQSRRFVRDALHTERAVDIVRARLERRERNFLSRIRYGVFENDRSPYRSMLSTAGVDYPRVEAWVADSGVEGTLEELRRRDVYVTYEEFKEAAAGDPPPRLGRGVTFENPGSRAAFSGRSSGSRSAGTPTGLGFASVRAMAVAFLLRLKVYDAVDADLATYFPAFPSLAGIIFLLFGINLPEVRHRTWYTPLDPRSIPRVYRAQTGMLLAALRLSGGSPPRPRYAPLEDPGSIAEWLAERRREGRPAALAGYASACVRVARAASEAGIDLDGTLFVLVGEPVTPAKDAAIRQAGGVPSVSYAMTEAGAIAGSCPHSVGSDDLHLYTDSHAFIRHSRRIPGRDGEIRPLMITSLLPGAPKILLNVETDDYGDIEDRPCPCLWGELGMTRRISNLRSFAKLTAEGMTFSGKALIEVIERTLPERFGGSALDWQLVEEEDAEGHTRLALLVHPSVGPLDDDDVLATLEEQLAGDDGIRRFMSDVWREAGSLRLRRQPPITTGAGKLFPFHSLK